MSSSTPSSSAFVEEAPGCEPLPARRSHSARVHCGWSVCGPSHAFGLPLSGRLPRVGGQVLACEFCTSYRMFAPNIRISVERAPLSALARALVPQGHGCISSFELVSSLLTAMRNSMSAPGSTGIQCEPGRSHRLGGESASHGEILSPKRPRMPRECR